MKTFHKTLHVTCICWSSNCTQEKLIFVPFFPIPSPAFVICKLFNDGYSDWCEMVPHCSFDWHVNSILDTEWCVCVYTIHY